MLTEPTEPSVKKKERRAKNQRARRNTIIEHTDVDMIDQARVIFIPNVSFK